MLVSVAEELSKVYRLGEHERGGSGLERTAGTSERASAIPVPGFAKVDIPKDVLKTETPTAAASSATVCNR